MEASLWNAACAVFTPLPPAGFAEQHGRNKAGRAGAVRLGRPTAAAAFA